jgi:hypothetical protein
LLLILGSSNHCSCNVFCYFLYSLLLPLESHLWELGKAWDVGAFVQGGFLFASARVNPFRPDSWVEIPWDIWRWEAGLQKCMEVAKTT